MSKRWLINYLLFFLVILFSWIGTPKPENTTPETLLKLTPKEVSDLRIETKQGIIDFQKKQEHWYINNPIQWPASDINIQRIVSLVNVTPQSSLPNTEIDISTLGLRFPEAVVIANNNVIAFGDSNQLKSRRYIMVNETVHLIDDVYLPLIQAGLTGFIGKALLPKTLTLKQLELPDYTLSRDQSASWTIDNTFEGYSADQSNQLINNWQTLQSTSIKPYVPTKTPLKKISVSTEQGDFEFYLMSIQPEIILAREDLGLQYHFDDSRYYDLFSLKHQRMPLPTEQ
ncbi:MAG: hypothetical protein ISR69_13350 [Gammaproteobacteria bacterium]|nr:hypothetical protein [Gammaproteobacteria bacterium]